MRDAVICEPLRTPVGGFGGSLRDVPAHDLASTVVRALMERTGIGPVPEIDGVSAGGMPSRVKCLHVLVGHSLAAGPGVNPLGDEALAAIAEWWTADQCRCVGAWDTSGHAPNRDLSRHVKTQGLSPAELDTKRAERRTSEGKG